MAKEYIIKKVAGVNKAEPLNNGSLELTGSVLPSASDILSNSDVKKIAGATGVKEIINDKLGGVNFGIDGEGNRGYFKADGSFAPFKQRAYGVASNFVSTVGTIYPIPSETRRENIGIDGNNFVIQQKGTYYITFALATTTNTTAKRFNIWKNDEYLVQNGTNAYYTLEEELEVGDKIRGNCTNCRGGIITIIKID